MALRVKIDPVERFTEASVRADLALPEQKREVAAFVSEGIAEADQTNARILGRVPPRTITVDGRPGAALDTVNPDGGSIIIEWELTEGVLRWIAVELVNRSPHISGRYQRGWTLFADGVEVPIGNVIPNAEKYVFVNLEPYSRKIEIGKTKSGRAFVIQVPNRIAERTARDARSRFGNQAKILYGFESIQTGGAVTSWARSGSGRAWARARSHRREALHHEWLTRQPAIIVYPNQR